MDWLRFLGRAGLARLGPPYQIRLLSDPTARRRPGGRPPESPREAPPPDPNAPVISKG